MVHGLWDTPNLFRRLEAHLGAGRPERLVPHLPHRLGAVDLGSLARDLDGLIQSRYGPGQPIDLLGFSMGGVIGRIWLQELGGHHRTRRFWSVGSPQQGTLAAQLVPRWLLPGIADMKIGSSLLRRLNQQPDALRGVSCESFFSATDITVFPGWRAVLPMGPRYRLPVWTHRQLIVHPLALERLGQALLAN
ncbi:triacylglycerol lipase [Cyanobium sp. WAJ14-Wanaka]|uniref:esterase/lipase family protein n=1 Tax=Cyanobium sp. WAJ14-Wanaka TaxID=2823725 RepID=UPI0020CC8E15|nr:alpha/beta fold hydrolase [Cyanobium sp. WAJ14-Wanaka]MCP9774696.1 alpha/beta fold hydrolase [Cyanobium sp. WAJ14-Wanaka]